MSKNFLLIVEGEITEKCILKTVLKSCNVNIVDSGKIELIGTVNDLIAETYETETKDVVVLVQGPRNRIHDWLKYKKDNYEDFENYFKNLHGLFAGVFIIYDVDHTSKEDLYEMFEQYNDETDKGLLLVSSPCIEVIADIERNEDLKVNKLTEYKKELNIRFNRIGQESAQNYIKNHFDELILYYINKNSKESDNNNVMEHPLYVVNKINELNERLFIDIENQPVHYKYFTTVVYICIAYINGLTKEVDNVGVIKEFFNNRLK